MFDAKNINKYCRFFRKKIKAFLLSKQCKEALIFLFFVLVASAFWLLQTLDGTFQTELNVPLRLKNVPKDVVLTSDFPDNVQIKVEDRGTVLLNYLLGRTFFPITFDFRDYLDKGNHVRISSTELLKKVSTQLNVSTKLISIRPDTLDFVYTRGKARKIPIRLDASLQAGQRYYVAAIKLRPDSALVYAPQGVLDTLSAVYTRKVNMNNISDSADFRVELIKVKEAKLIPSYADVAVYVDMYSEKTVEVPVVGINFPAGKVLRTFPSKVQVTFQVGLRSFKAVHASDFFIGVTYEDVLRAKEDKLYLSVKGYPDNVNHIRINPVSVDYLIEQQSVDDE